MFNDWTDVAGAITLAVGLVFWWWLITVLIGMFA